MMTLVDTIGLMRLHSRNINWRGPTELRIGKPLWDQVRSELQPLLIETANNEPEMFMGLLVVIDHINPCTLGVR